VLRLLGMSQDNLYCNSRLPFGETAKEKCNYEILRSTFHIADRSIATATARTAAVHAGSSKALQVPLHQKRKYSKA
jgi:hypothetical protein